MKLANDVAGHECHRLPIDSYRGLVSFNEKSTKKSKGITKYHLEKWDYSLGLFSSRVRKAGLLTFLGLKVQ